MGGAGSELAAFEQGDAQAAEGQVMGDARPGGPATDDHNVRS
jgi:hypothetical protein